LKKLIMLAVILALALAAAVPAIAQVSLENEQETESGDVALSDTVANKGDYASQCTPAFQQGNTGNFNNAPAFVQYASTSDDFEPGGIEVGFGGTLTVDCPSTVQQSSAASA
jgi:uncharacterized protein YgiB involved in biofilm formation